MRARSVGREPSFCLGRGLLRPALALFVLVFVNRIAAESAWAAEASVNRLAPLLQAEARGTPTERAAVLAGVLSEIDPAAKEKAAKGLFAKDNAAEDKDASALIGPLHWHAGQIAQGATWQPIIELEPGTLGRDDVEYLRRRGSQPLDLDQHRELARYCKSRVLAARAKAHWFGVLDANESDPEARRELGFVLVGDRWVSSEEMATSVAKSKAMFGDLKRWMPKVRDWVVAIDGKETQKRLKAIGQLRELKDPRAIFALEVAVGQVSLDAARHFINAIARFRTREASVALAGIAIADPSSKVGIAAVEGLRDYPLEFYVPDLLDIMCTEYELRNQAVTRANGELVMRSVQVRELRDRYEASQLDRLVKIDQTAQASGLSLSRLDRLANRMRGTAFLTQVALSTGQAVENDVAKAVALAESQRIADDADADVDKANASIREFQRNVATVLRATTGAELGADPKGWWEWWDRYEESYLAGPKRIDSRYAEDRSSLVYVARQAESVSMATIPVTLRKECLVRGTLIQTESGLKPIESIRVGDQVVSQAIASGELRLRPVLRTTVRPKAATRVVALADGETIRSTLGHRWWVIGNGWVKTKDLQPGMAFRTSTGFAAVHDIQDADAIETYNLVVDEDHTYFVGRSRLLSFDASEVIPTFQTAPGFPAALVKND